MPKITANVPAFGVTLLAALCIAGCGSGSSNSGATGTGSTSTPVVTPSTASTTYAVGGTVSGLAGTIVLQDNGGDSLTLTGDNSFAFSTRLANGVDYIATILSQPASQTCKVSNAAGTISAADVTSVTVTCTSPRPPSVLAVFAGTPGGAATASFKQPSGIATDLAGNVYVADQGNNTILKITTDGVVTNFAGTAGVQGSADATGAAASFNFPTSVATDHKGNVFVADTSNETIRKITPAGVVTTFVGTAGVRGFNDATGAAASFTLPYGAATDSAGNLFVADSAFCTLRRITPDGVVTTPTGMALGARHDCTGAGRELNGPFGLTFDLTGNIYVAHTPDQVIIKISPTYVVSALAGTPGTAGNTNATGTAASFSSPLGVASDSTGNIYVADTLNHTVRKVTPAGVVTTFAGVMGKAGFEAGPLPGLLSNPRGVAINGTTLYITVDNGVVVVRNLP